MGEATPPADYTLDDFLEQLETGATVGMIAWEDESGSSPGQIVALIGAMSAEERSKPEILDVSRRRRIAAGAGVRPDEVDLFLEQFARVRILMGKIAKMSLWQKIKMITGYESTPE